MIDNSGLNVLLYALIEWRVGVSCLMAKRLIERLDGALIARKFVAELRFVVRQISNLSFLRSAKHFAGFAQVGANDILYQVVPSEVEVSCFWSDPQLFYLRSEGRIGASAFGEDMLQAGDLAVHLLPKDIECALGMRQIDIHGGYDFEQVTHRKRRVVSVAIRPYVPDEEGEDDDRIVLEKVFEVEHLPIRKGCRYADIVQGGGITLVVLNRVGIGMKNVRVVAHFVRGCCCSLHKVVVICVHTGDKTSAEPLAQVVRQRHFLTLPERSVRGEHHLKTHLLCFQRAEQIAPEAHIVIALHIGNYAVRGFSTF